MRKPESKEKGKILKSSESQAKEKRADLADADKVSSQERDTKHGKSSTWTTAARGPRRT